MAQTFVVPIANCVCRYGIPMKRAANRLPVPLQVQSAYCPSFWWCLRARGPLQQSCSTSGSWKSVRLRKCPVLFSISRGRGHFKFKTPWIPLHRRCGSRCHYTKPSPHGAAGHITSTGGICFGRDGSVQMAPLSKSCGTVLDSIYKELLTLAAEQKCRAKATDAINLFHDFSCVILDVYTAEFISNISFKYVSDSIQHFYYIC